MRAFGHVTPDSTNPDHRCTNSLTDEQGWLGAPFARMPQAISLVTAFSQLHHHAGCLYTHGFGRTVRLWAALPSHLFVCVYV